MRPKRFPGLWYVQCKPFTYLASRLHSLQMDQNELPVDPCHLVLPSGASKMISEPMVRLKQTVHLSCIDTNTVSMDQNEIPHDARHLGVPWGASKTISDPMVCSVQTVQLSCVKISTIPKRTLTSFHLRLTTKEHHWLRPK